MGTYWSKFKQSLTANTEKAPSNELPWKVQYSSSNCFPSGWWLHARILVFLFWFGVLVWSIVDHTQGKGIPFDRWFIYVTHWGLSLELVYFGLAAYTTYRAQKPTDDAIRPAFLIATNIFYSISLLVSFLVFVLYWALVFDGTLRAINVVTHGVNFLLMALDGLLNKQPLYFSYTIFPFAVALTYLSFTLIFFAAGWDDGQGNNFIYRAIDWNDPQGTGPLVLFLLFIAAPSLYCFFVGCYKLELCCSPSQAQALKDERMDLEIAANQH